jgi:translation initiation factor 5A
MYPFPGALARFYFLDLKALSTAYLILFQYFIRPSINSVTLLYPVHNTLDMATASELGKGSCFEYKGEPVRVMKKEVVVYGTHSHSKLKLYCRPVFGGGEKIVTFAHEDKVEILDIKKKSGTVIAKLGNRVQIMDGHTYETLDAEIEPELLDELKEGDQIIFVDYKGEVRVIEKV